MFSLIYLFFLFVAVSVLLLQICFFRSPLVINWFTSLFIFSVFDPKSAHSIYLSSSIIGLGIFSFIRTIKFDRYWSILNIILGVLIVYFIQGMLLNYTNDLRLDSEYVVMIGFIIIGWHIIFSQYEWGYERAPSSHKLFMNKYPIFKKIYIILLIFLTGIMYSQSTSIKNCSWQNILGYLIIWLFGFYLQRKIRLTLIRIDLLWNLILISILTIFKVRELEFISAYMSTIILTCLGVVIKNLMIMPPVYAPINKINKKD